MRCDIEDCDKEATVNCHNCGAFLCDEDSPSDGGECPDCCNGWELIPL